MVDCRLRINRGKPSCQVKIGKSGECARKARGLPRTLCNAMVFAERHPRTARFATRIMCSALQEAEKHPRMIRRARGFIPED